MSDEAGLGELAGRPNPAAPVFVALRRSWVGLLTCRQLGNPDGVDPLRDQQLREAHRGLIADILAHAQAQRGLVERALAPGGIEALAPAARPPALRGVAQALKDLAIAAVLAPPDDPAAPVLTRTAAEGLAELHRRYFNTRGAREGNWWEWEIGIPGRLLDVLALLPGEAVPARLRDDLLTAIARALPDPDRLQGGLMAATGANRVWAASGFLRRAILEGDALRLLLGRRCLEEAIAWQGGPDGFRSDGSFVQHGRFAYSGGYGIDFLLRAAELAVLLQGSPWALPETAVEALARSARHGLLPFLVDGAVMDMVRGREIARHTVSDHAKGHMAIRALLVLAEVAPPAAARQFREVAKQQIAADPVRDFFRFDPRAEPENMPLDVVETARRLMQDQTLPAAAPPRGVFAFPEMERVVLRAPRFTVGIALHGRRTASYESLNGENLRGWFTAYGMTNLYAGDGGHFQDGFWPTVDAMRLPGTTVNRRPRAPAEARGSFGSARVGVVALDQAGVAAMELRADHAALQGNKSWFLFEDGVVALGSSISDTGEHAVETIVENRNLGEAGAREVTVDGQILTDLATPGEEVDLSGCRWLHVERLGGYVFPRGAGRLRARIEDRSGAWRDISAQPGSPEAPLHRRYLTLWLDHGVQPRAAGYGYVLLPGYQPGEVAARAEDDPCEILAQSYNLHALRHRGLGITAAVVWRLPRDRSALVAGPLTLGAPSCVLLREAEGCLDLAVSPLMAVHPGTALVRVEAPGLRLAMLDPALSAELEGEAIVLRAVGRLRGGLTLRADFVPAEG